MRPTVGCLVGERSSGRSRVFRGEGVTWSKRGLCAVDDWLITVEDRKPAEPGWRYWLGRPLSFAVGALIVGVIGSGVALATGTSASVQLK